MVDHLFPLNELFSKEFYYHTFTIIQVLNSVVETWYQKKKIFILIGRKRNLIRLPFTRKVLSVDTAQLLLYTV